MVTRFPAGVALLLSFVVVAGARAQETPRARDLTLGPATADVRASVTVPRGYALVVGISNYQNLDESKQLRFPESDAAAIHRVLISQEAGAFPAENVHVLLGRQATLANIRRELEEWLPSVAQPSDRVVVFFAGHGFVKNGAGYLAPWDVDTTRLDATAYPMAQLGQVLAQRVKASLKLLLTDACHSGKINPETTNETLDLQFSSLPRNFLTFTATTEREQSYEDPSLSTGFGFFTYFLTQGWKGHADNDPCNGVVTVDELIEYVRSNVRRYARERQVSQTPTARGDYDSGMVLGVSPACVANVDAPDSSMLGTAIVEANMDDVSVYVDGELVGQARPGKPLVLPRLSTGLHEFKGVRDGYAPETKRIMISPGQQVTVTLRIRYARAQKELVFDRMPPARDSGDHAPFSRTKETR